MSRERNWIEDISVTTPERNHEKTRFSLVPKPETKETTGFIDVGGHELFVSR